MKTRLLACFLLSPNLMLPAHCVFAADQMSAEIAADFGLPPPPDPSSPNRVWAFAGTITLDWAAFPIRQHISFSAPFDFTGIVWLTGEAKSDWLGGAWTEYATPRRMNYEPWITEYPPRVLGFDVDEMFGGYCCWYTPCQPIDPDIPAQSAREACDVTQCCTTASCPVRQLFEAGTGMDIDGRLRIVDRHGGAVSHHWIILSSVFSYQGWNTYIFVNLVIVRPGQWDVGFMVPGSQLPFETTNRNFVQNLTTFPKALAVHISSSDIPGASRGFVDSSDLAALAQGMGRTPTYPYGGGCKQYGETAWCWYADLNMDGAINSSDVAVMASEINGPECSNFAKTSDPNESTERILAWFGMEYSGRMINVGWTELPKVVIVDEAQMQRAILDPYGYRNLAGAPVRALRWSRLKTLYR